MTTLKVRSEGGGVVAAGHPQTVSAAAAVLRAGGNAYDAAVAAGFAAAVTEPTLTSVGGGGFLLAATADGERTLVDFFVDTPGRGLPPTALEPHFTPVTVRFPSADQEFHVGWGSVAVPGCLDGYLHVHRRFGRLELDRVLAPALRLARDGVAVNAWQAKIMDLLDGVVTLTSDAAGVFAPEGSVLREGGVLRNERYADLLEQIAYGRVGGFADPFLAGPLVAAMRDHGGLVTSADLDAYRVVEREPLSIRYRGAEILTNPAPSFGGTLVVQALASLSDLSDTACSDDVPGARRLAAALVAMGDSHATALQSSKGTTQVSVADADGNVASMTTSNGSCSGVFAPGTGVHMNNIMGERDLHPDGFHAAAPGLRVGSMMCPSVVLRADGTGVALGSGGSERIRSAVTQVMVNLLDRGMTLQEAVEHPRVHWDGTMLQVEPGLADDVVRALRETWPTNEWPARDLYFGGAHSVGTDGPAAGDPRRGGATWSTGGALSA